MSRIVEWSREALDDLRAQLEFIADDNPNAARRVRIKIWETADRLGEMATGRPGRVSGSYEKPVSRLPYILAYAIVPRGGEERVVIVRVIHSARDWPDEAWPE